MRATTVATLTAAVTLFATCVTATPNRYSPPRTGLKIIDGPSALAQYLSYPCGKFI